MGQFILNGRNYSGLTYAQGVFIDTDNVIQAETSYTGSFTYTASQDCYVLVGIASINSGVGTIAIDGVPFQVVYNTSGNALEEKYPILLKKGQVLSVTSGYNIWTSKYTVYGIQQGSPVTFLSEYASACYDTTEREVGCWVDGKPLYKRTWDFSASPIIIPYNDWVDTGISASVNIEKIISAESQYGSLANMGIEIGTGAGGFVVGANRYENTGNTRGLAYLTLLYTKTTDVAGSGKLTPTAMPTVHYSTSEQVIGTFLGKTLYQRTWDITSGVLVSYNAWTDTSIDSTNIENIVSVKATHPDGTCYEGIMADPTRQSHTVVGLQTTRNGNDARVQYVTLQYTKSS